MTELKHLNEKLQESVDQVLPNIKFVHVIHVHIINHTLYECPFMCSYSQLEKETTQKMISFMTK